MYRLICAASVSSVLAVPALARQLISVSEEIALGKQAQRQVRTQASELKDRAVAGYVPKIGRRLATRAMGMKYPYSFSVADSKEINVR